MTERNLLELPIRFACAVRPGRARREVVPAQHARRGGAWAGAGVGLRPADHDHGGQAGQRGHDVGDRLPPAELLAAVAVALGGQQHLRGDLREPVDHARRPEVGRARRPDGAEARRGEQADKRLRHVGQEGGDPVALGHPEHAQRVTDPGDLGGEFPVGQGPLRTVFRAGDDRRGAGVADRGPQCVARVVEGRPGEPLGVRHGAAGQHRPVAAPPEHPEVVPDRLPELTRLVDRPLPEFVVGTAGLGGRVAQRQPALPGQPAAELRDPRPLDDVGARFPQRRAVVPAQRRWSSADGRCPPRRQ